MALRGEDGLAIVFPAIVAAAESVNLLIDKIQREKPIESLEMVLHAGQLTIGNANTEVSCIHEGMEFRFQYENVNLNILGHQLAAYVCHWYPNEPLRVGSLSYQDNAIAALTGTTDTYARIKINCPAAPGKWLTVTSRFLGQTYISETIANTGWAAGVLYYVPRYGNFNTTLSVNYLMQDAVAAETLFLPPVEGETCVAAIFTPWCNRDAMTADAGALCLNNLPAQGMETDWITSLKVDVGADRIWEVTTVAAEFFRTGVMGRMSNAYGAPVATTLGHATEVIRLNDYIVPIEYAVSGTVSYRVNCNTSDLMICTIFSTAGPTDFQQAPQNRATSAAPVGGAGEQSSGGLQPTQAAATSYGTSKLTGTQSLGPMTLRRR